MGTLRQADGVCKNTRRCLQTKILRCGLHKASVKLSNLQPTTSDHILVQTREILRATITLFSPDCSLGPQIFALYLTSPETWRKLTSSCHGILHQQSGAGHRN
jgi:hypothetical protein